MGHNCVRVQISLEKRIFCDYCGRLSFKIVDEKIFKLENLKKFKNTNICINCLEDENCRVGRPLLLKKRSSPLVRSKEKNKEITKH